MKTRKLTNAIRASILDSVAKDLFKVPLQQGWKIVESQFTDLVKGIYKDFDWGHVEPYRKFMHWHKKILLLSLPEGWNNCWCGLRSACSLPVANSVDIDFEYPSRNINADFLEKKYQKQAEGILRPYMVRYLAAKKYYEDVKQLLLGITTSKQLRDVVPELAKYLPDTETAAVTALVPIEQINRVRNLLRKETD